MSEDEAVPKSVPSPEHTSDIEDRLREIEQRIEGNDFGQDAAQRKLLINEIEQRIKIKWISLIAGYLIVTVLMILLWSVASAAIFFGYVDAAPTVLVAALVTPILAITAITAILLIGAFRGSRKADLENVSVTSLASEAVRQGGGA